MLNTDAHNSNIKKKMTELEFIRINRGINSGTDLPAEYLADIYQRITCNEIKMERESFPDALKMGWLWAKGKSLLPFSIVTSDDNDDNVVHSAITHRGVA